MHNTGKYIPAGKTVTDSMKAVDDADNVHEDDDRLLLGESFLADHVVLQVHQVRHLVSELVRDDAVENQYKSPLDAPRVLYLPSHAVHSLLVCQVLKNSDVSHTHTIMAIFCP